MPYLQLLFPCGWPRTPSPGSGRPLIRSSDPDACASSTNRMNPGQIQEFQKRGDGAVPSAVLFCSYLYPAPPCRHCRSLWGIFKVLKASENPSFLSPSCLEAHPLPSLSTPLPAAAAAFTIPRTVRKGKHYSHFCLSQQGCTGAGLLQCTPVQKVGATIPLHPLWIHSWMSLHHISVCFHPHLSQCV